MIVENKLETLETQFKDLKSSLDKLAWKFECQGEILENQMSQDAMWTSMLEDRETERPCLRKSFCLSLLGRLTSAETNLLFSYVCKTLAALRCLVIAEVPDLAEGLPTTATILRRKARHPRIQGAWEAALQGLGLREGDVRALCTFFTVHGHEAQYYAATRRQLCSGDVAAAVSRAVKDEGLRSSLLRAVEAVDEGRAQKRAERPAPRRRAQLL
ncbi:single-pass membrane and coiled-coil domain-containing protein 1 [Apteryx rowi]|uniref:single-pass membrane and coiled-coil domain-containing protein 1 n=1 Tax=Apteryx rowi TaxID=308060 RepID=UPI000E1DD4D8|nr:single-pass membrane and coiled-coil domain-containing protein 1 [Apteryx rowi]